MKKHYILFASLLCYHNYAQNTYNSNEILKSAYEEYKQNNYKESIIKYEKINISDPFYLISQYEIINNCLNSGELEKALQLSTKLYNEKRYEEYPSLLTLHGIVLSSNDKLDESLAVFDQAEKKLENSTFVLFNKAVVYQKKKEFQQALSLYERIIYLDPSHSSALYNLGVIALEDGAIVNGTLALMTYLMVEPVGSQSKNALIALNKKYHQNYSKKQELNYNGTDQFNELHQLLMAQIPYHENFKLKVSVNDIATRNMQFVLDYLETKDFKEEGLYAEKFAMPLKKIATSGETSNYIYSSLLSIETAVEKDLNKQKKNIENYLTNFLSKEIIPSYLTIKNDDKYYRVYRESNEKAFVQVKNTDFNFKEGNGYSENITGYKTSQTFFVNDVLNGVKKEFAPNGTVLSEQQYKNNQLNGDYKEYYTNEMLKGVYTYKDDALNGKYKTYYPIDKLNCEGEYKENYYSGKTICYHPNGKIRIIANYLNGNLDGDYESYDALGNTIIKATYSNNMIEGSYIEYYSNKKIKQEAKYQNGKPISNVYYFDNDKKSTEYIFNEGKLVSNINYRYDGSILNKIFYDSKERKSENHDYNRNNEVYQIDYFKSGVFDKTEYKIDSKYSNSGFVGKQLNVSALGGLLSEGMYAKEFQVGEWKYYNGFGKLKTKNFYDQEGNIQSSEGYDLNNEISYKASYKDGAYYGLYQQFQNNKLIQESYYNENGLNGPEKVYYPNGNLRYNAFYFDNVLSNKMYSYNLDNKLIYEDLYINDLLVEKTNYLLNEPQTFKFQGKTGVFTFAQTPVTNLTLNLKDGVKEGNSVLKAGNNVLISENYINSTLHGKKEEFNLLGKKIIEFNYVNGLRNGKQLLYNELGYLRTTSEEVFGVTQGHVAHYYYNGNPYSKIAYEQDIKHGAHTFYDFKGNKIAELNYYEGTPIEIKTINKEGVEIKTPIKNGDFDIVSYYKNGNKSIEINFKNYQYNGVYNLYFENGKPAIAMNFLNGDNNGAENFYYENGNLLLTSNYENDQRMNKTNYYSENGQKVLELNYMYDLLHGNQVIYENNKVKINAKYNSDYLVEM